MVGEQRRVFPLAILKDVFVHIIVVEKREIQKLHISLNNTDTEINTNKYFCSNLNDRIICLHGFIIFILNKFHND